LASESNYGLQKIAKNTVFCKKFQPVELVQLFVLVRLKVFILYLELLYSIS
jgi:hypothetical protein